MTTAKSVTHGRLWAKRWAAGLYRVYRDECATHYLIRRGAYQGTTDDRSDRWYMDRTDTDYIDCRGRGHFTIQSALHFIAECDSPSADDPSAVPQGADLNNPRPT